MKKFFPLVTLFLLGAAVAVAQEPVKSTTQKTKTEAVADGQQKNHCGKCKHHSNCEKATQSAMPAAAKATPEVKSRPKTKAKLEEASSAPAAETATPSKTLK